MEPRRPFLVVAAVVLAAVACTPADADVIATHARCPFSIGASAPEPFLYAEVVDAQTAPDLVDVVGCTNVADRAVHWVLLDPAGTVLTEGTTEPASVDGRVGAFAIRVPVTNAIRSVGTVEVFVVDPSDVMTHLLRLPVVAGSGREDLT